MNGLVPLRRAVNGQQQDAAGFGDPLELTHPRVLQRGREVGEDRVVEDEVELAVGVDRRRLVWNGLEPAVRHVRAEPLDRLRIDVRAVDLGRLGQRFQVADVAPGTASEVEEPPEAGEVAVDDRERTLELDEMAPRRLVEGLARPAGLRRGERRDDALHEVERGIGGRCSEKRRATPGTIGSVFG